MNKEQQQEALNRAWDHFITQGNPLSFEVVAQNDRVECRYLGPKGERCAFAIQLTPEELDLAHRCCEGELASRVIQRFDLKRFQRLDGRADTFYDALQQAHDPIARRFALSSDQSPERARKQLAHSLRNLAETFDLEIPPHV